MGWTGLIASRVTVPASGAVMAASIFMASMVAITCPAVIGLPSVTWRVTVPLNGAGT